jgi:hypothetical protein
LVLWNGLGFLMLVSLDVALNTPVESLMMVCVIRSRLSGEDGYSSIVYIVDLVKSDRV